MKEKFLDYLDQFCNYLENIKQYSPLTVKTYYTPIKEAIDLSEIYEEDIVKFDIRKYRLKISKQSNKTINKKLSSIRSFVNFVKDKGISIKLIGDSSVKSEQTLPKPVDNSIILKSVENLEFDDRVLILLIYSFGLRISEVVSLKIDDIKSDTIIVTGKGNKQRQIPANKMIVDILKEYLKSISSNIYLFEKDGKPLTVRQLQYRIDKAFKNIGLKVTPHQLRHSFATDLLNNGARINDISELLGHSSLKATGIYTKLNTNTKLKQYNNSHPLNKIVGE